MIRTVTIGLSLIILTFSLAWASPDLLEQSKSFFEPIPSTPPQLAGNPASPDKLLLGRMLFFEPRLSASSLISCQTCHNVGLSGADMQETSVGHGWQKGPRNAPTTHNAVFNTAQFWDGRAKDLAEQAKGPVQASVEMNNTPEQAIATLASLPEYVELFKKAFPQDKAPLTFDNMAKAIEVFEATLLTPNAPFDQFLKGNTNALTDVQKTGLQLFLDKGCVGCHSGINIGGTGYFPFGVVEKPESGILPLDDTGRFKVTNVAADEYAFRSPSLRNVALTPPYFHSGKVWKLLDSVRIMGSAQLGITLTDTEAAQITAFLRALTGEQPHIEHPILPPQQDETPRPVLTTKISTSH